MNKKCLGCGSILQNTNATMTGFVPNQKEDMIYCERCFRLLHYHELPMDELSFTNQELLEEAKKIHKPVYYFLDLFQISKEALDPFLKINQEKYLVLTKIDIIPKTISMERLLKRIQNIYKIDSKIFSYTKKSEKLLATLLNHMENSKTSLLLGMTNAGKSSFLKEAIWYQNHEKCPVLVSEMPNTTLSFLDWKVNNIHLIDAPGFSFKTKWNSEILLKVTPKVYMKPITMQMKRETILNFENTVFLSQNLEQNSITFYGNQAFIFEKKYKMIEKKEQEIKIKIDKKSDLVLPGVGFFAISKPCQITIQTDILLSYEVRPSFFGGSHD